MSRMTDAEVQALANEYAFRMVPTGYKDDELARAIRHAVAVAFVHGFAACDRHWCDRGESS